MRPAAQHAGMQQGRPYLPPAAQQQRAMQSTGSTSAPQCTLNNQDSSLCLKLLDGGLVASPPCAGPFGFSWSGARCGLGVTNGRYHFTVTVLKKVLSHHISHSIYVHGYPNRASQKRMQPRSVFAAHKFYAFDTVASFALSVSFTSCLASFCRMIFGPLPYSTVHDC